MKGVVFNLLEAFIEENLGEGKYEEILDECTLMTKEPFVGPGTYPDQDLMTIVAATIKAAGISLPEALRTFGSFCFHKLSALYPGFVTPYSHPKQFLMSVESVIHVEVKKLYEDASPPGFTYIDPASDRLIIQYRSERSLCQFMEGLIDGVAGHFQSPVHYKQRTCMLDGAVVCEFDLTFVTNGGG